MTGRIKFGQYKGTRFEHIPAGYLLWLWNENIVDENKDPELAQYIVENIDWLEQEAEINNRHGLNKWKKDL